MVSSHKSDHTSIMNIIIESTDYNYCKTLNISVPLMLAKLAMRYHSLTFMVAKMFIITHAQ